MSALLTWSPSISRNRLDPKLGHRPTGFGYDNLTLGELSPFVLTVEDINTPRSLVDSDSQKYRSLVRLGRPTPSNIYYLLLQSLGYICLSYTSSLGPSSFPKFDVEFLPDTLHLIGPSVIILL